MALRSRRTDFTVCDRHLMSLKAGLHSICMYNNLIHPCAAYCAIGGSRVKFDELDTTPREEHPQIGMNEGWIPYFAIYEFAKISIPRNPSCSLLRAARVPARPRHLAPHRTPQTGRSVRRPQLVHSLRADVFQRLIDAIMSKPGIPIYVDDDKKASFVKKHHNR